MRVGCSESVLCSSFYVLVFEILQLLSHGVSYVSFVYPAIDVANKVFRERRVETKIKKRNIENRENKIKVKIKIKIKINN